jgi:hypothetical protein
MFGALLLATRVDMVEMASILLSSVLFADLCHNDNIITPPTALAITE